MLFFHFLDILCSRFELFYLYVFDLELKSLESLAIALMASVVQRLLERVKEERHLLKSGARALC